MDGYLLIDKPVNWTSFDVVAKVRGVLRAGGVSKPKVGHTGTLDPLASGLLILVVGSYCKQADKFAKLDKSYAVTAQLGQTSTTGDEEGSKTLVSAAKPSQQQLDDAIKQFLGPILQQPPQFSAIKVNGQRAYQLARQGKAVKLEPRPVTIHKLSDIQYDYPTLKFVADVSSGTYIRSLVEDIGQALATGAYTSQLRRLTVGPYDVKQAIGLEELTAQKLQTALQTTD